MRIDGFRLIETRYVPTVESEKIVRTFDRSLVRRLIDGKMLDLAIQQEHQILQHGDMLFVHPETAIDLRRALTTDTEES